MWRWHQVARALRNPQLGAELGVKEGRFTAHMLRRFPGLHMVAVDLWAPRPATDRPGFETYEEWDFDLLMREFHQRTAPCADRLTVLREDTVQAAARFEDGTFDFVFIDAEHTYEAVRADAHAWLPKVKPGGMLCGHDYTRKFPGVIAAVNELGRNVVLGDDRVWMVRAD